MQPYTKTRCKPQRFAATKPKSLSEVDNLLSLRARADMRRERVQHEALSGLGAVGCAVSHFSVWTEFLHSDAQICLVLEDDLHASGADILDASVESMIQRQDEWDIALLGWCNLLPKRRGDGSVISFPTSAGFVGAQAYMLTRHAAEVLTKHLFPLEMQVDYAIQAIAEAHSLRIVPTALRKIRQTYTGSDVFRLCLLCEPLRVYAIVGVLVLAVAVLGWKVMRTSKALRT